LPGFLFKSSKSFVLFLGTLEGLTVLLCRGRPEVTFTCWPKILLHHLKLPMLF
jgi:hypothetical protein